MTQKRSTVTALAALALLLWMAQPAAAQEEGEPFAFGDVPEAFVMGGLTGGGSFGSPGGGGFLGGEASLAWLYHGVWGGFYMDGFYDFGHGDTTLSIGPELGYAVLGLDGGLGLRLGQADDPELGGQMRLLVSLGNFSLFGRYGFWPGSKDAQHVGQVGVLLKFPFWSSAPIPAMAR